MNCRHCQLKLEGYFLDLGFAPPSNAYLYSKDLSNSELYYPLVLRVCGHCWLVQTEDYTQANKLFLDDYAYFSSVSKGWLIHAREYSEMVIEKLKLNKGSLVIEVASNDGYLLKNFISENIPCLGIEPTESTAEAAEKLGVPVIRDFFGEELANQLLIKGKQADLICGNNVYAHVPDINDFTRGLKIILKSSGTITLEFPHLMRLIEYKQFDTVYHEHFSYLSLYTVSRIFTQAGLRVWDVEELSTHGGSLRVYGCHIDDERSDAFEVSELIEKERELGLQSFSTYANFQKNANQIKDNFLTFLINNKSNGKKLAAYGAAAKGNTLLNFSGIKPDLIPYVCDEGLSKQGKYLPGSHIPILSPSVLRDRKPDIVIIFPWNIADEVIERHNYIKEWGGKFYTVIPEIKER